MQAAIAVWGDGGRACLLVSTNASGNLSCCPQRARCVASALDAAGIGFVSRLCFGRIPRHRRRRCCIQARHRLSSFGRSTTSMHRPRHTLPKRRSPHALRERPPRRSSPGRGIGALRSALSRSLRGLRRRGCGEIASVACGRMTSASLSSASGTRSRAQWNACLHTAGEDADPFPPSRAPPLDRSRALSTTRRHDSDPDQARVRLQVRVLHLPERRGMGISDARSGARG